MSVKKFVKGTIILTGAGILSRILGFFFKIYLSRLIGAEGMGLYQLIMPVNAIGYAIGISGFEIAVSRLTALYISQNKKQNAFTATMLALMYSLGLCIIFSVLIYLFAKPIAIGLLENINCTSLIKAVTISLPFCAIHCMVSSYFLGRENTVFPAVSQLLEQLVRIAAIYFVIEITGKSDALAGVICLVIAEIGAAIFSISYLIFTVKDKPTFNFKILKKISGKIFSTYLPISANKVILLGVQSAEIMIIPKMLVKSGLTISQALATIGVISGMCLPLILFPATLSNSIGLMLLPNVSKNKNNPDQIIKASNSSLIFSSLFGLICILIFITVGGRIGAIAFKEPQVEIYINILAWLCPFIFLSTTFKSILNALGKSSRVFANNMLSEIICIIFIVVFIPLWGIKAYLYGLLISQATNAILQIAGYCSHMKKIQSTDC